MFKESMKTALLSFVILCMSLLHVQAYHIAGGDLTSTWVGGNNFEIRLTLYRDCSNPAAANFDPTIIITAYVKNTNALQDSFHLDLNSVNPLALTGAACVPPPTVCMEIGDYVRVISLPPNPNGYYLVWERCCRNSTVTNLQIPDRTPMLFYHEMTDPAIFNSSPVFNSPPLPFTCVNQFFRFNFDATDADGDSLVYALTTPIAGGNSSNMDPNPFSALNSPGGGNDYCPPQPYNDIIWEVGYGVTNICGSNLPLTINSATGLVEGIPDFAGFFAMAVTVYEYRNGIKIGEIKREIEFTVIPCTDNTVPNLSPTALNADYEIYETDTLCFTVSAVDPDGDSVYLKHFGEVFAQSPAAGLAPPYAVSSDTSGKDSASVDFCWYTQCWQGRDSVYHLQYEITDNGCPLPLLAIGKITIRVRPVPVVEKPNLLCLELSDSIVTIHKNPQPDIIPRYFQFFSLYRSENGGAFQLIKQNPDPSILLLKDSSAPDPLTNDYCYYITATNTCGEVSLFSDTLCTLSQENKNVNYISSVSVNPGDESTEITWADFPDGPYSTYLIERRYNEPGSSFSVIASLTGYTSYRYTDFTVFPDKYSYCYRMKNINFCSNESEYSNESCTILLTGESTQFSNRLFWTSYEGWAGDVANYSLERGSESNGFSFAQIAMNPASVYAFEDFTISTKGGLNSYRIIASEGPGGLNATSTSNQTELIQSPLLYIPNAFTPNGDDRNNTWSPGFSFVREIEISIFNRWGQQIFFTKSPEGSWDGKFEGRECPEGVYAYLIRYTGYDKNDRYQRTGSITLIR